MSEYKLEPAFGGTYTSPQQQGTSQCTHPDLEAQLAEAKAVLERIDEDNYNCPWPECPGEKGLVPHAADCRLLIVLGG